MSKLISYSKGFLKMYLQIKVKRCQLLDLTVLIFLLRPHDDSHFIVSFDILKWSMPVILNFSPFICNPRNIYNFLPSIFP